MSPYRDALHLDRRRRELVSRCCLLKHPKRIPPMVRVVTGAAVRRFQGMPIRVTVLALALVALVAAGCGAKDPKSNAPTPAEIKTAFAGSPAKLQSLHSQANQLLGGGKDAFQARMRELR